MSELSGKTVIVTGASAGLGRAIAIAFADAGAKVGLIARTEEGLKDAQAEIAAHCHAPTAIAVADTADAGQLTEAATSLESALGTPDIWVNNAMETIFSRVVDITPAEYRRVTDVNYLGFVHGTLEALKRMTPRNSGHIIQVGSALAYRPIPLQSAYCGSKFAIRGFTDSLRCELIFEKSAIRLTTVHMPALNTVQFSWARTHIPRQPKPVGTIYDPAVGADAVVHAARYPRREYWVGGSTILAILGNKVLPGLMDWIMAKQSYRQQWVADEDRAVNEGNMFRPGEGKAHKTRGQFSAHSAKQSWTWNVIKVLTRF